MKFRFLYPVLFLICSSWQLHAQNSVRFRYGVQFRYQPIDFFAGISASMDQKNFQHEIQFNNGVNSTFFQRRWYPQISYRFSWLPVNKRWIQTGPLVLTNLATRRFNKESAHGFSFEEHFMGGISIGSGRKSRIRFTVATGLAMEQNWSSVKRKQVTYYSWTFLGELSYSYAF